MFVCSFICLFNLELCTPQILIIEKGYCKIKIFMHLWPDKKKKMGEGDPQLRWGEGLSLRKF